MRSEEELEYAFQCYGDLVRKICFIHMKQTCDVDDVFQNVFLKYANGPSFDNREHEKAWLIRVTINACKDSLTTWFRKKVSLHDELDPLVYIRQEIEPVYPEVLEAVLQLDTNYRNVIYLHYYEDYKIVEIASILQKNENTIHTWLRRAKVQLKDILGGEEFA